MGVVIVHVVDDACSVTRDFRCDIRLLLAHMRLLAADLHDVPGHDVEITIKCDVATFAWLMAYVKADSRGKVPAIDLSNCLHLMLASNYLQMGAVLTSSVAFIATHLVDLAASASQQLCNLSKPLLNMLAKTVLEETLETLFTHCEQQQQQQQQQCQPSQRCGSSHDPNCSSSSIHAVVEKLYKHKLRALLQQHNTTLLQCKACGDLYASSSHTWLQCSAGIRRSSRQHKLTLHEPDPCWSLQQYLVQQRSKPAHQQQQRKLPAELQGLQQYPQDQQQQVGRVRSVAMSWRELYWLVWGHVVVLYCQHCCSHFPARLFHQCGYHPLPAVFLSDVAEGQYPCCGRPAWRPGAPAHQPCCCRDHLPYLSSSTSQALQQEGAGCRGRSDWEAGRAVQLLQLYRHLITVMPPGTQQRQQQQQQQGAGCEAASGSGGGSNTPDRVNSPQQQQQRQRPVLPLLVKMVNKAAVAAVTAAHRGDTGTGSRASSTCPRPASGSPLPPLASPRQMAAGQPHRALQSGDKQRGDQQQLVWPSGVAALRPDLHAASCSPVMDAGAADSTCSSSRSCSDGGSEAQASETEAQEQVDSGTSSRSGSSSSSSSRSSSSSSGSRSGSLEGVAAHTPLSSIMGAVRSAAEAHTKGLGFNALGAGGSSTGGGRLRTHISAPLADTFSAGGKRVLTQTGRTAPHVDGPEQSRPSTAASLLSLRQQQLAGGGYAASRPGTSSSRLATGGTTPTAAAAAAGGKSGVDDIQPGELSSVAAVFNRTLLLEMIRQDDAYRMGVLMRRLDTLRLQPPPSCNVAGSHSASMLPKPAAGRRGGCCQLAQGDVQQAVNALLFPGLGGSARL